MAASDASWVQALQDELHAAVKEAYRSRQTLPPAEAAAFVGHWLVDHSRASETNLMPHRTASAPVRSSWDGVRSAVAKLGKAASDKERKSLGTRSGWDLLLEESALAQAVRARRKASMELTSMMSESPNKSMNYSPIEISGAIFCGHVVTDCDSIAGAIGAACLFGGTPAAASEVNSETAFALQHWQVATPERIESIVGALPDTGICLVDHQQRSQLSPAIPEGRICGLIDHHALQSQTIVTTSPIFVDIRPWGSMATIVAHHFMMHGVRPPRGIAGMLLSAILSDTLNLKGPTTTEHDRTMLALLATVAGVDDINDLAKRQFQAKSKELAALSAHQLVCGDKKEFGIERRGLSCRVGFAVVETTDDAVILSREDELIDEIDQVRNETGVDALFVAVVNIVALRSKLLCAGAAERSLAKLAFGGELSHGGQLMDLGGRCSIA